MINSPRYHSSLSAWGTGLYSSVYLQTVEAQRCFLLIISAAEDVSQRKATTIRCAREKVSIRRGDRAGSKVSTGQFVNCDL